MSNRYQTKTYTVTVAAGATHHHDDTSFGPSSFNLVSFEVQQDAGGTGGSFALRVYKDAAFTKRLIRFESQIAPLYSPVDVTGGLPGVQALEGRGWVYDDDDATGKLHTDWDNNDSVDHVYTITAKYEEVGVFTSAGNETIRGTGSFLTSVALRGATTGVVTIAVAATAGTWTLQLPTTGGTNNYAFTTDGSGVASWSAIVNSAVATTNQTAVSGATGAVTISLAGPHNFTSQTVNGVVYGNGTGALQSTAQGAANSVLIGVGSGAPQFSTTPQVVRLGIGAAADAVIPLLITHTGSIAQQITGGATGPNQLRINNTGGDTRLGVESSAGGTILANSAAYSTVLLSVGATKLHLGTNDTTALTIDGSQNVGIGLTGPAYPLDVVGFVHSTTSFGAGIAPAGSGRFSVVNNGVFEFGNGTTDYVTGSASSHSIQITTNSTVALTINSSGNATFASTAQILRLGLGAAPDANYALKVVNSNGSLFTTGDFASGIGSTLLIQPGAGTGNTYFYLQANINGQNNNGTLALQPNGGNVGINTSSPVTNFHVNGSAFVAGHTVPTSGAGLELYYLSNTSGLLSYDRTGSAYKAIVYDALSHGWNVNGSGKMSLDSGFSLASTYFNISAGVGSHAVGGAIDTTVQWIQRGSFAGISGNSIYGLAITTALVEAGSGVHPEEFFFTIAGSITNSGATATDAGALNIATFTAATGTTNATALRVAAPTGGGTLNDVAKFLKSDGTTIVAQFTGSGAVLMPNLATASINESAYLCLDSNGQLISDSTTCLASLESVKDNLNLYTEPALPQLMQMRVKTYDYKSIAGKRLSFVADDMAAINPLLGGYGRDGQLRTYDDRATLAVAIKTIQEQQYVIEAMSARLNTLQDKINA